MKIAGFILLIIALAIPASASSVVSWTQKDIPGHNLTLNYTSEFNVAKDDTLGISIKNIGNESENDTITINKIKVIGNSDADGTWTGEVIIEPNSSDTINFDLNVTTDDEEIVNIRIYYKVNSEDVTNTLNVKANYPGQAEAPEIKSWGNNITNSRIRTFSVNIDQMVRFNATADQQITTWKWYKDNVNVRQTNNYNYDNFSTSWDTSGNYNIKVNATNDNGTSNNIIWNVMVNAPSGGNAPNITSWSNNKTNDSSLSLYINRSETVKFNFTSNQTLTSWIWTLNGEDLHRSADNLTYTFNHEGTYRVRASGSNGNGSTQTIVWKVIVKEKEVITKKTNAMILAWSPQVVDYVYVNDTINETITYSITTAELMETVNWSEDGVSVDIDITDNTSTYTRKWTKDDLGFHTIIFKGSNDDTNVEFRWYVNVYNINGYEGGCLFCVIDDELEDHVADVKFRMFKYKIAKYGSNSEDAIEYVNRLHDRIAARQMTREALRNAFKAGDISISEYVAALKQIQRDVKYELKLAEKMTKIEEGDGEDEQDNEYKHDDENERRLNKLADMNNKMKAKKVEEQKKKENPGNNGRSKKNQNGNNKAHNEEDD